MDVHYLPTDFMDVHYLPTDFMDVHYFSIISLKTVFPLWMSIIFYQPKDNAEQYREAVEAKEAPGDPFDPAIEYVGGFLCAYDHPDEEERLET